MHYYQFNIGDYQSHTLHLTEIEDIAYRRLLDWSYLHEKPLPNNIEDIARLIRMRTHCECIANVLREFFVSSDDGWFSPRVQREIAAVNEKSHKAKASADARWRGKNANALRTQSECNATHYPLPITQDPVEGKRGTRLPNDWELPKEWSDWAAQQRPELDIPLSAAKFADYWHAQPGAKGLKLDWQATWRNWIRGEKTQTANANRLDVSSMTVPGRQGIDPALQKLNEDKLRVAPIPKNIKEAIKFIIDDQAKQANMRYGTN
jgi:uncharacterized protein YdaU (DUF1376 family)